MFYNGAEFRGVVYDSLFVNAPSGGGTFDSFDWGDGTTTTTINSLETIQVTGGQGIDFALTCNDIDGSS
jgi:hypothetical protein